MEIRLIKHRRILPYKTLKFLVKINNIKTFEQYWKYRDALPSNERRKWPHDPHRSYGGEYSFEDLFGHERYDFLKMEDCSFEEFLVGVRTLGIASHEEYTKSLGRLSKLTGKKFPKSPSRTFGSAYDPNIVFPKVDHHYPYRVAKKMVQEAGVKSIADFYAWRAGLPKRKKDKMPQRPEKFYKGEYSFKDFFGVGYLPSSELSEKVKKVGLRNRDEYREYRSKLPPKEQELWPYHLTRAYPNINLRVFFGVDLWELNGFYPIGVLSKKVKRVGLLSIKAYMDFRLKIKDKKEKARWPQRPDKTYPDFNYLSFFGVNSPEDRFYSYDILKIKVKNFKIRGREEYRAFRRGMTDKNEKRRWPSVPRSVYPEFSREDFFYREDKRSMTLSEVVVFLESKKAVYASDYSRLQKEEPLLPPRRKIFNGGKIKCSDELFRFRSNDSLIKVANLYYYNLKEFRRFLRLNAVVGQKEYLKFKRGLPLEERKFFPQRPKEIYLRFYGDLDGVGAETNFYRLWGEFGSAAEMSISVRALGIKDQQSLRKMSQTIPALSVDPRVFEDWPGKMLGYTEDEAWEIFFNVYDPYKDCSKGDGCVDDLENDIDPELASVEISEDFNDDDISRMLASIGDSVISFDD